MLKEFKHLGKVIDYECPTSGSIDLSVQADPFGEQSEWSDSSSVELFPENSNFSDTFGSDDIIPWDEAADDFAILIQTMNDVTQNETQVDSEVNCFESDKISVFKIRVINIVFRFLCI